jgi:hypothetical protein
MPIPEPAGGKWRIDLDGVRRANAHAHTGATPGLLGQRLHELGLTTAVVSPGGSGGEAALALADEEGIVDGVWAGEELRDPDKLRDALAEALRQHAVVLADLSGMDSLEAADRAIGEGLGLLWPSAFSLVVVLSPRADGLTSAAHPRLSPVVVGSVRRQIEIRPGLLTSASTRREGLVTAADIAPTLLEWWGRGPFAAASGATGHVIRIVESHEAAQELDRLDLMLVERQRLLALAAQLYAVYMGALLAAALAVGSWWRRQFRWLAVPALVGALLPVGLLVAPLAGLGQARQLLVAAGLAIGGALAASCLPRPERSLAVAMLIGAAVIVADTLLGSPLMRRSAVGFSVVSGSRFYGIGNECVGVLAAMAAIGLGALLQEAPQRRKAAALIGVAVALAVGAPWWGANWGGYVAILVGLVSMWMLASRRRAGAVILGLALIVVAASLPAFLDLLRPVGERTHIGSAAALVGLRTDVLAGTVVRKLEMNSGIARVAGWWWLLAPLAGLAALGMLKRVGTARQSLAGKLYLCAGLWGAVVSALVAMVVNDSGVVSMAMALAVASSAVVFIGARST